MRSLTANLLATIALALCAPAALAQGMTGAGGTGGAGGGGDSQRVVVVPVVQEAERTSACVTPGPAARVPVTREGLSQARALDPSRKINEAVCTKPFDFLGKGNLCCI